jgi:hypothetical protein
LWPGFLSTFVNEGKMTVREQLIIHRALEEKRLELKEKIRQIEQRQRDIDDLIFDLLPPMRDEYHRFGDEVYKLHKDMGTIRKIYCEKFLLTTSGDE